MRQHAISSSHLNWLTRSALHTKPPDILTRVLHAEEREKQTKSANKDGAPDVNACALPYGVALSRHEDCEGHKGEG